MSVVLIVGAVWMAVALGLGLFISAAIRVTDRERSALRGGRTAVDGDPCTAPVPAPPLFETAGAPALLPAPRTRRRSGHD